MAGMVSPFQQFGSYGYPGNGVVNNYYGGSAPPQYGTMPNMPAGNQFDPLNFALQTGGAILANNQQQAGANGAIGMAGYNGTPISGPGGTNVGYNPATGGYSLGGPTSGPMAQFAPFASNAIGYAGNNVGANNFDTAANGTLSAFQNFNPSQFANTEYGQLNALTQPSQTAQTQQMLNYEQASGRGGLNQNGVLGDMGGLALAQSMQDTNNALQATTDARNQGNYLANLATTFQNQGNANRTANVNNAGNALTGELNINSQLQNLLQSSISASNARANAGANQGNFRYASGVQSGNNYGNYFGALGQTLNNTGGASGLTGTALNYAKSLFGGGTNSFSGTNPFGATVGNYSPTYTGPQASDSNFQYANNQQPQMQDPTEGYDYGGGDFTGASGQAANQVASNVQSTNNAGVAGYSTVAPQMNPELQDVGGVDPGSGNFNITGGGSTNPFGSLSSAAGTAGNALAIAQGLSKGGVSGYGSAAVNAGSLANKFGAFGGSSSTAGGALGAAGGALAMYNGIKAGGVAGYTNAALGALNTLSGIGSLAGGAAAGGLGTMAALGAFAGPLAIGLAPVLMGMESAPVTVSQQHWDNIRQGLQGNTGNATMNANQSSAQTQQEANMGLVSMIANGQFQLPPDLQQYAEQNGLYQAADALKYGGSHIATGGGEAASRGSRNQY